MPVFTQLSPPPDAEASVAAMKSIIGEVFSDISLELFEHTVSLCVCACVSLGRNPLLYFLTDLVTSIFNLAVLQERFFFWGGGFTR